MQHFVIICLILINDNIFDHNELLKGFHSKNVLFYIGATSNKTRSIFGCLPLNLAKQGKKCKRSRDIKKGVIDKNNEQEKASYMLSHLCYIYYICYIAHVNL